MDFDGLEVSPVRSLKSLFFSLYRVRDLCVMKKINRPSPFLKIAPGLSVRTLEVAFERSVQFLNFCSYRLNGSLVLLWSVRTLRYKFKNPSFMCWSVRTLRYKFKNPFSMHSNVVQMIRMLRYNILPTRLCAFERCTEVFEC